MEKGKTIKVLDHGYVRYIDSMGSDQRIVEAARISYKSPSKGEEQDKKLLFYLYKNRHTSPFEMVKLSLNIKLPVFIMRQYVRHRMQNCISGDNFLYFDLPNALKKKNRHGSVKRHLYKYSVKNFYEKYHSNLKNQYPLKNMKLRFYNEDTKMIESTNVIDIWKVGKKDVYELQLENGYKIKTTLDHKFYNGKEYIPLQNMIDLRIKNKLPTTWKNEELFYCNGIPSYKNKEMLLDGMRDGKTQEEIGNEFGVSKHTIKKWMSLLNVKYTKEILGKISSRKLRGRKRGKSIRNLSDEAREKIRNARSGNKCNFWKGGISKFNKDYRCTTEYNRWKYNVIQNLIKNKEFKCCITGDKTKLVLHHIEPVWKNKNRYMDESNVIPIREDLHKKIHSMNLEETFESYINSNRKLNDFFEKETKQKIPTEKKLSYSKNRNRESKISPVGSRIKNITYIGEEMVYDLEVNNKYHNFICNGFILHNCNEVSARYTELPNEFYIPDKWRKQDTKNKQGSVEEENWNPEIVSPIPVTDMNGNPFLGTNENASDLLKRTCDNCYCVYQNLIHSGVAREMARMVLPLNIYTEIYCTWDLKNLLHFLSLREDSHAQWEIQQYAFAIKEIVRELFPWTMEAYEKYKFELIEKE